MILICTTREAYAAMQVDILVSQQVEGGTPPVMIQEEPAIAADGIRCCFEHDFDDATADWFRAYTANDNPAVLIVDVLPADWYTIPESL